MQEEVCDESKPETCVCEMTDENSCEQEEVSSSVEQQSKKDDDSCNQLGMTSPLMFAIFAAFTMKKFSKLFN